MPRTQRTRSSTHVKSLSRHAPAVMTQRLSRMARPAPNAADLRELARIGPEKIAALQSGWLAMMLELAASQQRAWMALWQGVLTPWTPATGMQWWRRGMADADAVMAAGMRPAALQVTANARRLARRRS